MSLARPLVLVLLLAAPLAAADDPFAANVRPTEPLSPAEERAAFRLPPGFEIQLVAAEPDIQKPLNMAFDAQGRLWVSDTTEYPYPAPPDRKGRDTIKILEDTDGDGRADKITTFADGLNIPVGLYPYKNGVVAFSIPNIWWLEDTDGDGRCDHREILYGPFDTTRDAHGLNNSFHRGYDGWLYACHGFNNHSRVAGRDGHVVEMQSGNTYRVRLDGSRIEQFTHGQVNPFGMAFDQWGNIFTADCHSKPISQLLRDAWYPSFGRPHDGLGFVPPMMDHLHGSTAIAGLAYYTGLNFPPEYRGDMFSGNVMTSRVNHNSLEYHGSTILARAEADFVATSDPWFRPVNLQVGPDGALYIADFYNKIIGHYEVPLDHPGRDRHRGRIWRIVHTGDDASEPAETPRDLTTASVAELLAAFKHPVLAYRMRAADQLVDRVGPKCAAEVRAALNESKRASVRRHALWVLFRLGAIEEADFRAAASDADATVRTHAMKALAETPAWPASLADLVREHLQDDNPFVARAAAEALGLHPDEASVRPLLDLIARAPAEDNHLRYVARWSLREQLRHTGALAAAESRAFGERELRTLAELAAATQTPAAAAFLLRHVQQYKYDGGTLGRYVEHVARHLPAGQTDDLAALVRKKFAGDVDFQLRMFRAIQGGLARRGAPLSKTMTAWGRELAGALLAAGDAANSWTAAPLPGRKGPNPWHLQPRKSADGNNDPAFLTSRERETGVVRSPVFEAPAKLSFWLAGHRGPTNRPPLRNMRVRLRSAKDGSILAEAEPPRNDVAQRVAWNLASHVGERAYLELEDANDAGGYAWMALGRLQPAVVKLPAGAPQPVAARRRAAAELAATLGATDLEPALRELLTNARTDPSARTAAARAVVAFHGDARAAALAGLLDNRRLPPALRTQVAGAIAAGEPTKLQESLVAAFHALPRRGQAELAQALAADRAGAAALLELVEQGKASARLLRRPALRQSLAALDDASLTKRADKLTAGLPSENEALQKLIAARLKAYRKASSSVERGAAVFAKHCAACHQIAGKGAVIGPQLDGIGGRGLARIAEDILDPNRNVDVAFRTTTIVTADGRLHSGLVRREEGATLVLANAKGEEFSIPKDQIDQQHPSPLSLMPDNVAATLPEQQFHDLLAYLLSQRK